MLPLLLGGAVFGLAISQNNQPDSDDTFQQLSSDYEFIDDFTIGRLRDENIPAGSNFLTENSRIIRPKIGRKSPIQSAKEWTNYHRAHNQALKDLYAKDKISDNQRILRVDTVEKRRIPHIPHPGGMNSLWKSVPNVYFEYSTPPNGDFRLDNDYNLYDDKVGQAGGMPIHGWEYIWNPVEWFGNPWGPSGQLYHNLRTKENYPSAYGDPPEKYKNDKRVRFGGVTLF